MVKPIIPHSKTKRFDQKVWLYFVLIGLNLSCSRSLPEKVTLDPALVPYPFLSDYAFFQDLASQTPSEGVLPYEPVTPLFSDYAHKARFVWMPPGVSATVDTNGTLQFPDQSVLIKTFYYPADFREPNENWQGMETRLLIKQQDKWEAFTYVWEEDQQDARLTRVGDFKPVGWTDQAGKARKIEYAVPNQNQCKSCHSWNNELKPIGPKVSYLNHALTYPDGETTNQITRWQLEGYLTTGSWTTQYPSIADWKNDRDYSLEQRALAYLEVNCGHCHRPEGPAHTTGLYLTYGQEELRRLGFCKPPVAAGKGSGNRRYGIEPGNPGQSILVYRMESDDPGVMMPELGRVIPHKEGLELVKAWIENLEGDCP